MRFIERDFFVVLPDNSCRQLSVIDAINRVNQQLFWKFSACCKRAQDFSGAKNHLEVFKI